MTIKKTDLFDLGFNPWLPHILLKHGKSSPNLSSRCNTNCMHCTALCGQYASQRHMKAGCARIVQTLQRDIYEAGGFNFPDGFSFIDYIIQ